MRSWGSARRTIRPGWWLEASGQHEVLNWLCLAGAAAELGHKMHLVDWVETWIFNAPKCLAVFR